MNHTKIETRPEIDRPVHKAKLNRDAAARDEKTRQTPLVSRVISNENGFLSLRAEWNSLVDHSPVHIYQTFDWQWFWWKHYGANNTLHIVTFRSDDRLVGIIPMFVQPYTVFGKTLYKRLRMIGCGVDSKNNVGLPSEYGPSDYLDVIVLPEYASEIAELFASYVMLSGDAFDEVQFSNVPQRGFLQEYFVSPFEAKGFELTLHSNDNCPYLSMPPSAADFLDRLRPSTRYRVRQSKKEFIQNPPFGLESVVYRSTLDQAFTDLMHLHQIRWNRLGYAGLFSDPRFTAFQKDVLHSFYEQGLLWFKAVRMGGIRTAARLGFFFKGRMYDYLSGFDETLPGAKKRPSLALLISMIEDAIEKDAGTVDFLRGNEAYKFEMTRESTRNTEIFHI
ncbi:MAG: GNAT family N-acetyltransferase [Ignavibacteriales bacterium]|nr:GNAT family N-acetyltransferase [Ignavibacteriales bacterium]